MREIPKKNYFLLLIIMVVTVIITLSLSGIYKNRHHQTSDIYNFLSKVTVEDFETYLSEKDIVAIYIDDKEDLSNNKTNKRLIKKIIKYNLNDEFVFVDKNDINDDFIKEFNDKYEYKMSDDYPVILVIKNQKVLKVYDDKNIDNFDFGVFQ